MRHQFGIDITTTTLVLWLVVIASGSLAAQTRSSKSAPAAEIENAIKSKEPAWELSDKEAQPKSTIYRWNLGSERVEADVFMMASPSAATDEFKEFIRRMPVPPKEKLKGLGDEALLWQSPNTSGCMILFHTSTVFFHIDGTSVANTKRFAKHLDDLFRPK